MLFRRPSVRYGRTPEPETPYQKAAQAWDERIGAARIQARNWRLIAFGNLCLRENIEWRLRAATRDIAPLAGPFQARHRRRQRLLALGHHSDEIALMHHLHNAAPTDRIRVRTLQSRLGVRLSQDPSVEHAVE